MKAAILDTIKHSFGDESVAYGYFESLKEPEIEELAQGFSGEDVLDRVIYICFRQMHNDSCPIAADLQSFVWGYLYHIGSSHSGFTRRFTTPHMQECTLGLLGSVLLKLMQADSGVSFNTTAQFRSLISSRMEWLSLDIIRSAKRHKTSNINECESFPDHDDQLENIVHTEERAQVDHALNSLTTPEQKFLVSCLKSNNLEKLAEKEVGASSTNIRKAKSRLVERLRKLVKFSSMPTLG